MGAPLPTYCTNCRKWNIFRTPPNPEEVVRAYMEKYRIRGDAKNLSKNDIKKFKGLHKKALDDMQIIEAGIVMKETCRVCGTRLIGKISNETIDAANKLNIQI